MHSFSPLEFDPFVGIEGELLGWNKPRPNPRPPPVHPIPLPAPEPARPPTTVGIARKCYVCDKPRLQFRSLKPPVCTECRP